MTYSVPSSTTSTYTLRNDTRRHETTNESIFKKQRVFFYLLRHCLSIVTTLSQYRYFCRFNYSMSCPQSNGLMVGNYLLLGRRLVKPRETTIELQDNYAKYFRRMGLERYEMMILTGQLYTSDPLSGLDVLEPITSLKDAKN